MCDGIWSVTKLSLMVQLGFFQLAKYSTFVGSGTLLLDTSMPVRIIVEMCSVLTPSFYVFLQLSGPLVLFLLKSFCSLIPQMCRYHLPIKYIQVTSLYSYHKSKSITISFHIKALLSHLVKKTLKFKSPKNFTHINTASKGQTRVLTDKWLQRCKLKVNRTGFHCSVFQEK